MIPGNGNIAGFLNKSVNEMLRFESSRIGFWFRFPLEFVAFESFISSNFAQNRIDFVAEIIRLELICWCRNHQIDQVPITFG
jgi:hypothetical protein